MFKKNGIVESNIKTYIDYNEYSLTTLNDTSIWLKVFEHNSISGTVLFTSESEALYCNTTNKYSIMYMLDEFKNIDDKLELMLCYPDDIPNEYNRWKQLLNPFDEFMEFNEEGTYVTGYEAIHIDWTTNKWGGLNRTSAKGATSKNSFVDGSVGHPNWFYSIAPLVSWNSGNPGPETAILGRTQLFVRVDNLFNDSKFRIINNKLIKCTEIIEY